ncbi:MAG: hypothetical protein K6G91_11765 [Kiritimatiellae bacterium]|nr:hypothetical protein [Kiritimatiellia bacterium]
MTTDELFSLWDQNLFTEIKFLGRLGNERIVEYDSDNLGVCIIKLNLIDPDGNMCFVPDEPDNPYSKGKLDVVGNVPKGVGYMPINGHRIVGTKLILMQ